MRSWPELIGEAGGDQLPLAEHPGVRIPGGAVAAARSVDLGSSLGWLVAVAGGHVGHDAGPSLGLARPDWPSSPCDLVARGQVVPTLEPVGPADGPSGPSFASRWQPVPGSEARRLGQLAARMPETVAATAPSRDRTVVDQHRAGTHGRRHLPGGGGPRLSRQAPPVVARSLPTASEAFLAGLGNGPYQVEIPVARELAGPARGVGPAGSGGAGRHLDGAAVRPRRARRLAAACVRHRRRRSPAAAGHRPGAGNPRQQRAVRAELDRLVHLVPALGRANSTEALLGNEEAWTLMTETAPLLEGAGFAVQVPSIGPARPSARLRLDASPTRGPSVVGTAQLTAVRWSAVDRRRRAQRRRHPPPRRPGPAADRVTRAGGSRSTTAPSASWPRRSADRDRQRQMTQADILRHALGLEGGLGGRGGRARGGRPTSWPRRPRPSRAAPRAPQGFRGELRSYQAAARGWLHFLDTVGLGGCLALDMGLGKTPTVLAHLARHPADGPGARRGAGRRRRQLGHRGAQVHARAAGPRSTTGPAASRPRTSPPRSPATTW